MVPFLRGNVGVASTDEAGSGLLGPVGELDAAGIGFDGTFRARMKPDDEGFLCARIAPCEDLFFLDEADAVQRLVGQIGRAGPEKRAEILWWSGIEWRDAITAQLLDGELLLFFAEVGAVVVGEHYGFYAPRFQSGKNDPCIHAEHEWVSVSGRLAGKEHAF